MTRQALVLPRAAVLDAVPFLWLGVYCVLVSSHGDQFLAARGLWPSPTLAYLLVPSPFLAWLLLGDLRSPREPSAVLVALWEARIALVPLALAAFLSLAWALLPGADWSQGGKFVLLPTFTVVAVVVGVLLARLEVVRKGLRFFLGSAFFVLLATVLVDVAAPGTFSKQLGRAAGLAENANTAAFLLVALCALLVSYRRTRIRDLALLALCAVGLLATLSRGGAVLFALLLLGWSWALAGPALGRRRRAPAAGGSRGVGRRLGWLAGLGALAVMLALAGRWAVGEGAMFERPTARARLAMLSGEEALVARDEGRMFLLDRALGQISEALLLGRGTGWRASDQEGSHNLYLETWLQGGLPGLAAALAVLAGGFGHFLRRGDRGGVLLVVLVAVGSLVSDDLWDDRALLLLYGCRLSWDNRGEP